MSENSILKKLFAPSSKRAIKKLRPVVDLIELLDGEYQKLSDQELQAKTGEFKQRLAKGEALDSIMPEAFAAVRETAVRVLRQKPFRVQIIGGIVLHQGRIAEMKTGEGKTLASAMPAYLNALTGKGVHVVTVNDYLAKFHSEWMGGIYKFLGMSVGVILEGSDDAARKAAYDADITYGTNNEFGFDYLRDNMATNKEEIVQRGHTFAIVDEIDSILIDEARTPLIISGEGEEPDNLYAKVNGFAAGLSRLRIAALDPQLDYEQASEDYIVDEKTKTVMLTRHGVEKAEEFFGVENLTDEENTTLYHHLQQALIAHGVKRRDVDYVVGEEGIVLVDEFTGRMMPDRRYSDGLHQALEAKERLDIEQEDKTLATVTLQNYFRMYDKLSGMTGTAATEGGEFMSIYKLDVIEIPTNEPMIRQDFDDTVYLTKKGKLRAVVEQIKDSRQDGQPVLAGTVSVEMSEILSSMLKSENIQHVVLNAKEHEREAKIIAQAGRLGAVTISTNMAGRGTDIILGGGNPDEAEKIKELGGLLVIGTERHEARRIDNQLRGRAGRQGDPGASMFFLSMEDDLPRLYGGSRLAEMLEAFEWDENTPIEDPSLIGAIETAQKRVESQHFADRKYLLAYDDVLNHQRNIIYAQRKKVLSGESIEEKILDLANELIGDKVYEAAGESGEFEDGYLDSEQMDDIAFALDGMGLKLKEFKDSGAEWEGPADDVCEMLMNRVKELLHAKKESIGAENMRQVCSRALLGAVDRHWMDFVDAMQELREGIHLRAYGQIDPLQEYRKEAFAMFSEMVGLVRKEALRGVLQARGPKRMKITGTLSQDNETNTTPQNSPEDDGISPSGTGKRHKRQG
ncbi:MAG: preprotein translocase subunit SecA [Oscillospiraceae bacterium]|nr:preprotein translocase subunit SecA [Oscillospiraceae bacterium]